MMSKKRAPKIVTIVVLNIIDSNFFLSTNILSVFKLPLVSRVLNESLSQAEKSQKALEPRFLELPQAQRTLFFALDRGSEPGDLEFLHKHHDETFQANRCPSPRQLLGLPLPKLPIKRQIKEQLSKQSLL